jgi:hypothetical protein
MDVQRVIDEVFNTLTVDYIEDPMAALVPLLVNVWIVGVMACTMALLILLPLLLHEKAPDRVRARGKFGRTLRLSPVWTTEPSSENFIDASEEFLPFEPAQVQYHEPQS